MCEVKVESRTRVEEHGRTVLYEKIYRGVPTQGGGLRLLAYYERRIPLAHMQMELRAVGREENGRERREPPERKARNRSCSLPSFIRE